MAWLKRKAAVLLPRAGPSRLPPCTCWRRASASAAFPAHANASPFEILSLPRSADQTEIKDRYYELAKLYHPDTPTSVSSDVAKERYRLISDAYALLKDPLTKQAYLRSGSGWGTRPSAPESKRKSSTRAAAADPFSDWDPGVNADSPYGAYSGHARSTYKQAYSPGSDWDKRAGYSRSSDEAAKRARYYRQAEREAARKEKDQGWPFSPQSRPPTFLEGTRVEQAIRQTIDRLAGQEEGRRIGFARVLQDIRNFFFALFTVTGCLSLWLLAFPLRPNAYDHRRRGRRSIAAGSASAA